MRPHFLHRRSFLKAAALLPSCAIHTSWAASPPVTLKRLQLVVPTPAGSQPDVIARWIIEPLSLKAGVTGVVINMPGASGALAADSVLRGSPENGPLLLGGLDHVAYSHLNSDRRALDPFVDFEPVAVVNRDTWVVATASDSPAQTLQALVERSRREPLNYASTGEGSTAHLLSARLCKGLEMVAQHIPYRDPWMPDLLAGRIQFVVAPTPAVLPQLRAGRLRALASLTDERLALPGTPPSIRELGSPDQVFYGGLFLFAPASLASLAPQLNGWFRETVGSPDIIQRYRDASIDPMPMDLVATRVLVRQRLQIVDAMRMSIFGKTR